jgi:putative ATP-dependent endonuclease of OLD family
MRIVRLHIERFRSIRSATLFPADHNVYLGPNNLGKTAVLEALNLLLNPEIATRGAVVDENDFYCREYRLPPKPSANAAPAKDDAAPPAAAPADEAGGGEQASQAVPPVLRIEAVLTGLDDEDVGQFSAGLVPWDSAQRQVVESTEEGQDPFATAQRAVRPCFEAWYDEEEDDFAWRSFFRTDPQLSRDASPPFTKQHKRRIGFLIYRDFRALQRPITLEPYALFSRLLASQDATPKHFESVLAELEGVAGPLFQEPNFARVVNEYRLELLRYLPLANVGDGRLSFEATDRTREEVKAATQLYVNDQLPLPLQKMGAGTRSLAILAMLLLIARKRGRGIIALEEPETFLFPHAQRRVVDEVVALATQTFVTTHSPYVLERMPVESFQRLLRDAAATVTATPLVTDTVGARQIRERFKRQLSEALLGRGAIIVEEESTRLWILKASALLHGKEIGGRRLEALELQGVSVVTAVGNGDVATVGALLRRAGLLVLGFLDQVTEKEYQEFASKDPDLPLVFHANKGLEDLLLGELPRDLIRRALIEAPYARHNYAAADVDSWNEDDFRKKAREFLRQHKGYQPLHEWILDQVDVASMPSTFKSLVALVAAAAAGEAQLATCSLLPVTP